MITLTILLLMLIAFVIFTVIIIAAGGVAFTIIFLDVIVFIAIVAWIVKNVF